MFADRTLTSSALVLLAGTLDDRMVFGSTLRASKCQRLVRAVLGAESRDSPPPASDVGLLNAHPANASFRFLRFRVTFEIGQGPIHPDPTESDLPLLEFLELPFTF